MTPKEQYLANREAILAYFDGKPVQFFSHGKWITDTAEVPAFADFQFRLKPTLKTVEYRVAMFSAPAGAFTLSYSRATASAQEPEDEPHFVKWLTDWTTIEYEAE